MYVAIMQPTYLPWPGYFNLISQSKDFVFFDDVKLKKRSWQTRNRILQNNKEVMLAVSLEKASRDDLISQVKLSGESRWREKHRDSLIYSYKKAPHSEEILDLLIPILEDKKLNSLADLNIKIIKKICELLDIRTNFFRSKDLVSSGGRSEKLLTICKSINNLNYLSPEGAREYIEEDGILEKNLESLKFQEFPVPEYQQYNNASEFIPYLSIVDLISNMGVEKAKSIVEMKN